MNIKTKLQNKHIAIATHIYATGPSHSLEDYLKDKVKTLLFIGHPFVYAKDTRSYYHLYKNNSLVKQKIFSFTVKSQIISLIKDMILTYFLVVKTGKFDVFIGVDSANAMIGVLLKWLKLVDHVVYYTIDYVPKRFDNQLLNNIYHKMDLFAVKNSDSVWNLSSIMVSEREKKGISKTYRTKQIVVPVGTDIPKVTKLAKPKMYHIAHMGHIIKKQGIQLLIEAIPLIVKKVPKFHLEIIGGGEYEEILKDYARKLKVSKYITFHGFVKSHKDVEKLLAYCELGVAPYTDSEDNYVRFTDPGKVKAYLASGLPVIITKVPEIYKYLEKKKSGIAVHYDAKELAEAISSLLLNRTKLQQYKKNAANMAQEFTWDKIFSKALQESTIL